MSSSTAIATGSTSWWRTCRRPTSTSSSPPRGCPSRSCARHSRFSCAASDRTIVCWAMGLTQHRSAVATIREITNTVLLRGSIGRPGAGLCPVRGHSNVQGDRTMGIYEKPAAAFLDRLDAEFGIPRRRGSPDTTRSTRYGRCSDGEVDVFFAMGGNFLSAAPDTAATARGPSPAASSPCTSRPSPTGATSRAARRRSSCRRSAAPTNDLPAAGPRPSPSRTR